MNRSDLSFYESVISDLFYDEENKYIPDLEMETKKKIEEIKKKHPEFETCLSTWKDMDLKIDEQNKKREEYEKTKTSCRTRLEEIFSSLKLYNYGSYPKLYNTDEVEKRLYDLIYGKIKSELELTETGNKILQIRKDRNKAILSFRLLSTNMDSVKEFIENLYTKFGKSLSI